MDDLAKRGLVRSGRPGQHRRAPTGCTCTRFPAPLRGGSLVNFAVDTLTNRYTSVGPNSLAYGDAGNLTTDKDSYIYTYDYENRITKVEKPDGPDAGSDPDPVARFAYDTQGRRIRIISYDAVPAAATLYYYSDNWQVLAEYTASGTPQACNVFGNYIDEVLLRHVIPAQAGIQEYFYLHDHLYSPVALLNPAGNVIERYEYDAYGKATVWNAALTTTYQTSQYDNPYAFTGRELDMIDSDNLQSMHYRYRNYDIYTGRLYQQDPHGINPIDSKLNVFVPTWQYLDGLGLFVYADANPVVNLDFSGLCKCGPDITQGLVALKYKVEADFNNLNEEEKRQNCEAAFGWVA